MRFPNCLTASVVFVVTGAMLVLIAAPSARAEHDDVEPIVLGERFTMQSDILEEDRVISVALPAGYAQGDGRYGVIYLLDGPDHLAHVAGSTRHLVQTGRGLPVIVVGIANTDRTRDLTPPTTVELETTRMPTSGGSASFRRFLVDELRSNIDARYRTNGMNILIGHSLGGLFAVDTMLEEPEAFSAYLAISPSLWWSGGTFLDRAGALEPDHAVFDRFVYLAMGNEGPRMNSPFETMAQTLPSRGSAEFVFDVGRFPDDDHGSVPLRATIDGLRSYFEPVRAATNLDGIATLDALDARYLALSARLGIALPAPEQAVNQLGYAIVQRGDLDQARTVFEANIERFPGSANAHDSLGECLEKMERYREALIEYELAAERARETADARATTFESNAKRMRARVGE